MKKQIFLLLILATTSLTASAQLPLHVGVKVGLNTTSLASATQNISPSTALGFVGGGFARIVLGGFLIQPELLFSQQNTKFDINSAVPQIGSNGIIVNGTYNVQATNLDIPIMVGWQFANMKILKARIMGGPVAMWNLSSSGLDGLVNPGPGQSAPSSKDYIRAAQWGVTAGAGIDLWNVTLDVRYQIGLSALYDLGKSGVSSFGAPNTGFFQTTIGFKII